jgi:hypothetical protein
VCARDEGNGYRTADFLIIEYRTTDVMISSIIDATSIMIYHVMRKTFELLMLRGGILTSYKRQGGLLHVQYIYIYIYRYRYRYIDIL